MISSRISSVENSVDELGRKADSTNAVFTGKTTLNGPAVFNVAVVFGDVGLPTAHFWTNPSVKEGKTLLICT